MQEVLEKQIASLYELRSDRDVCCLNEGENVTYRVRDDRLDLAVRIYHPRFTLPELLAEVAWLEALAVGGRVPTVVRSRCGDAISELMDITGKRRHCLATRYILGHEIDHPTYNDYERLGKTLRELHIAADAILDRQSDDWIGRQRPVYDAPSVVANALLRLESALFLSAELKQDLHQLGGEIVATLDGYSANAFVHADLHFGNVLVAGQRWWCLDFDECGFGYRAFDMGIIRTFMRAAKELDVFWPAFVKGYADYLDPRALGAASALRLFFMMGKIPDRLDLPHIQAAPERFIVQYRDYAKEELGVARER